MAGKPWSPERYRRRKKKYASVTSGLRPAKETSFSIVECEVCGDRITYSTVNGRLVALEALSMDRHRHQPPQVNSPARNRAMVAGGLQGDDYGRSSGRSRRRS